MKKTAQQGFSLIELMVSVAIGLIVTLAITGVLVAGEQRKRTSTSVNDINQTGAYLSYLLDKAVRSAGSGFSERSQAVFGCAVKASRNGTPILPAALPAPFTSFNLPVRMAPVVIGKGRSQSRQDDVLMVMAGNGGFAESAIKVSPGLADGSSLNLPNTLTFQNQDLLLLAGNGGDCLVTQVNGTPAAGTQQLALGGTYFSAGVAAFDAGSLVIPIGNEASRPPQFRLFGVGANNTLFSHDLLQVSGNVPAPVAEGVVRLHARYGVDTDGNGALDAWVDAVGAFSPEALLDGSETARDNLRSIVAVRVGLVLRTSLPERDVVAPETLELFQDLPDGIRQTFTVGNDGANFRHRTAEITIPVRNALFIDRTP
jgi:type IV pilus assembly protein PilW